jgi:hypothetical protein
MLVVVVDGVVDTQAVMAVVQVEQVVEEQQPLIQLQTQLLELQIQVAVAVVDMLGMEHLVVEVRVL